MAGLTEKEKMLLGQLYYSNDPVLKRDRDHAISKTRAYHNLPPEATKARLEILENLLGRTVIASTLDDAIAMARKSANRVRIVTLDGQVMNPGGSMTGGSSAKSAGVLSRANELKRLEQERGKLLDTQSDYKKSLQQAQSQLAETELVINTTGLKQGTYALPVIIKSVPSGYTISGNFGMMLFKVVIK